MANSNDPYGTGSVPEPPQYGQRSPNWQANPQPSENQPSSGGAGSPWPVYSPGNYQPGQGEPSFGGPPQGAGQYGQRPPGQVPPPKLPGRGWPIFTLVIGAIAAIFIAPAVFFISVLSGINFDSIADGSINTYNGGEVTVDETGTVALLPQNQSSINSCTLTGGGEEYVIYVEADSGIVVGRGLTPGVYNLQCDVPEGMALFAFNGDDISGIMNKALSGMIWASVVGVAGLVAAIIGIVWLVRRNRQRKEIMRTYWGGPAYY